MIRIASNKAPQKPKHLLKKGKTEERAVLKTKGKEFHSLKISLF
jgi:hypothetical protein